MKYTAGPWKAEINDWGRVIVAADPEIDIACMVNGESSQIADANARLISAAPELLEALKGALAEHSCDWNGCWCQDARAAIAKAEGQG
jgi:hypothetical protein